MDEFENYGDYSNELKNKFSKVKTNEEKDWETTKRINSKNAYKAFVNKYPDGMYSFEASIILDEFIEREKKDLERVEKQVWEDALRTGKILHYLEHYPNGIYSNDAFEDFGALVDEKVFISTEVVVTLTKIFNLYLESVHTLTKIEIFGALVTTIQSIKYQKNLQTLICVQTSLSTVPESIGNLSNLTILNLESNDLQELPESIGSLINLTHLNLGNNRLSKVPEFIKNLHNLVELNLSGNDILELPDFLQHLPNLKKIYYPQRPDENIYEFYERGNNEKIIKHLKNLGCKVDHIYYR